MINAVEWLYKKDYVDKNMIGLSGHFMGGYATAITAFFNVFGILIVMIIQYATFRSTGALWQWDMALGYIVLFPIVPVLILAAIFARQLYLRTGSIWLAGFVNALLFTAITVANTATNFNYILF